MFVGNSPISDAARVQGGTGCDAWKATLGAFTKAGLGNPRHSRMSSKKGTGKAIKKIFWGEKSKTMKFTKR